MKNSKLKKGFTMIITSLFVLSIGYFAVLPPTSAWFYQKYDGMEKTFIFGRLSYNAVYINTENIDLPAATKLEDPDEILFDEALHIVEIEAENDGTLPARVYISVDEDVANSAGLHYFYFIEDDLGETIKEKVVEKAIVTENDATTSYAALDLYNIGDGVSNNYGRYVVLLPGDVKTLKIAFWADYNEVGANLEDTDNVDVYGDYDVQITLHATQDEDGAFTRTY